MYLRALYMRHSKIEIKTVTLKEKLEAKERFLVFRKTNLKQRSHLFPSYVRFSSIC